MSRDVPIVLGTQDVKDSGIWATQWDEWDYPGMSQLSLGHRMGRTVGFGPPSGMNGIILGCPNCPWDTGWEGQWDLGHPVGWIIRILTNIALIRHMYYTLIRISQDCPKYANEFPPQLQKKFLVRNSPFL